MHYVLSYDLAPDYLARRGQFRSEHLRLARESFQRGELVLAGALADPVDNALLVFNGGKPEAPAEFARNDPYVKNGLISSWRVRKRTTVVGEGSFPP
jgi:uncharacterized protein YciI